MRFSFAVVLAALAFDASARDAAALRACLAANLPQRSLSQQLVIRHRSAQSETRVLKAQWFWQRGSSESVMLRLAAPADLAGAAYLLRRLKSGDELLMYLPSSKKVRKLSGAAAEQSLFDSGLSAYDLKFLVSGLRGGQLTPGPALKHAGRAVQAWTYVPPADPHILYDRIELLVDEAWCLPLQAKLFGGVPWKLLKIEPSGVRQVKGRWQAQDLSISDLRDQSSTQIEMNDSVVDEPLDEGLFKPRSFYRGP